MSRSQRRAHYTRIKARILRYSVRWHTYDTTPLNPRILGRNISTHGAPCSCCSCSPRKVYGARVKFKGFTEGFDPAVEPLEK